MRVVSDAERIQQSKRRLQTYVLVPRRKRVHDFTQQNGRAGSQGRKDKVEPENFLLDER